MYTGISTNFQVNYDACERIGCSNLRGGELGANKKFNIWLQLVCTKLKLIQAI